MNRLHKVAAGLGVAAVAVLGAVALLPHGAPAGADPGAGVASGAAPAPVDVARFLDTLKAQGYNVTLDSNHNGIPDVLKNFLYGSSLVKASTTGNGIPDGWLARNGFDPTLPGIELRLAAEPPAEALPPAYHGSWPEEFRWKLADVYAAGNATGVSLDPREWKGAGGIPSSWLHHHGLPLDRDVSQQPAAGGQSILQAYQDNLDPRDADADADGLPDVLEATRYHTDPHRASTTGSGVPDGWLVRFGLDPLDDTLASRDVAGKGMTVRDTWLYDVAHGGRAAALGGGGLDPTKMSQRGDRVPDGWLVRFGLDPLDAGVTGTVLQCAYDFPGLRERSSAPGQPTLPDLCLTVADDYAFGRPGGWDEAKQGPWLGGLDPSKKDQTGAGLPDAAGLHGWYVRRALDVGPSPAATWIRATTDPQRSDGDGDGLTDFEEFRGSAVREGVTYSFSPSDPGNVDTAFSGITDAEKAFATLGGTQLKGLLRHQPDGTVASWLDTARADTAGSYLTDGQYLAYWTAEAAAAGRGASYKEAHPGSLWNGYGDWLAPAGSPPLSRGEAAARLAPDGRVGGADADAPNLANPFPDRSDIPAGWKLQPLLVRFASPQQVHQSDERALDAHRAPLDPANPDTDGDRLKDGWELKHGTFLAFGQSEGEAKMLLPAGGFDLDPANAASFGSAVQDGEQNFDKDTVAWVSYSRASPGAPATPDPVHAFAFTNRFKVAADADPHVADGDSDGVTDGWVHFWRQCYPDPKCLKPSEQGDVVPSADDLAAHRIGDTRPGEQLKATLGYFRFVTQETPPALDAANGEALAGGTNPLPVSRGGGTVHVYTIVGTARESLADDAKAGLNPYLASTRGDGVPDVWKVYYGGQPECQAPDPRFPGASKRVFDPIKSDVADDPDGDSLSTAQEAALKTHPCKADSRGDGVDDGTAYRAGGMHLVPGGAQERAEGSVDTDSDGVPDKTELASGTDPTRADTAFAGLLDGPDQCRAASDPVVVGAPGKPGFLAQGIAHRHATTADAPCRGLSNPVLLFLGTHPGRNAAKQDSLSKGIPDGWTTYFGQSGGQGYACSRPAWWDEPRLGPWWWGTPGPCASRDLDRDGLDDRNGEDPVPAASQGSADATAGSVLRAALRNPAADAGTLRLLGQAFGDGAGTGDCAGDPSSCFNAWAPRTLPAAQLDFLNAGQPDGKLGKEDHFTVHGRLCATTCQLPDRAVVVRLWDGTGAMGAYDVRESGLGGLGSVLGVGFTRSDGQFDVDACLCAASRAVAVAGTQVALGVSDDTASWTSRADEVRVGAQPHLVVHAYATPGNAAAVGDLGVFPVRSSASTLAVQAPTTVAWTGATRSIPVTVSLADRSGAGAARAVQVAYAFANPAWQPDPAWPTSVTTDAKTGLASFTLTTGGGPADPTGALVITATLPAGDPLLAGATGSATAALQAPLEMGIDVPRPNVQLGERLEATATLTSRGAPARGVEVTASLGAIPLGKASTNAAGKATFSVVLANLPAGPRLLTLRVPPGPLLQEAHATASISIGTGSLLAATVPDHLQSGQMLHVVGTLLRGDQTALGGVSLDVEMDGRGLGSVRTGGDGRFDGSFSVAAFSGGSHTVAVRFAGIAGVAGTAQEAPLLVQAATLVRLPNLHLGPGGSTPFQGSLSDAGGRGVAGQVIHLALGKQPLPDVLTASNGLFNARVDLPADAPLGVLELTARFDGSLNKTFGPASAGAPLVVGSALRFEAPHAVLARGNNTITAQLVEQASGRGVEGVTVQAEVPGQPAHSEATDASGAFHVPVPVRDGRPGGDVVVHFAYPGDAVRGAADQDIAIPFAPATRIAALVPEEAGRGTDITVRALLVDDAGNRFAGTVSGAFLGLAQSAASDAQGRANLTFHVPADAAFGPATLTLGHAGDAHHAAASRSDPVAVKGGVRLLVDDLPAVVEPRAPLLVRFRAIDEEGHPVAGKPASVRLQGEGSAVLVQTDADGVATAALPAPASGAFEIVVGVAGSPQQAAASASSFLHVRSASAAAVPVTGALLLAGAGLALAAAAIVAFTLRRRGRIAAVLHRAAGSLQAGDPWAGGILLAYQGLSDALGRRGVQEQPGQSIRDFVSAVVAATRIPEDTAIDFVRLVEKARYAGQANRLEDALDARRVLARMVAVLEGAA